MSSDNKIMLCYYRLDIKFSIFKILLPKLFMNKNISDFQCEFYELAKHYITFFHTQPYKKFLHFTMIHNDI